MFCELRGKELTMRAFFSADVFVFLLPVYMVNEAVSESKQILLSKYLQRANKKRQNANLFSHNNLLI